MTKVIGENELQNQISEAIIEKWGYPRRHTLTSRKKQISINGFDILDPVTYRRFSGSAEPSSRPKYYPENKNFMKVAEGICKQFNYVVGYKPRQSKREIAQIRNPQPKSTIEVIEQKIEDAKKEIVQNKDNNDLDSQFKLNNKLNKLFRAFHKASKDKRVRSHSFKQSPVSTQNTNLFRQNTHVKPPKINYQFIRQRKRADSLLEPFEKANQDSFVESRKIQTKIMQQKQVLDLYKGKVEEMRKTAYVSKRVVTQVIEQRRINENNMTQPEIQYEMYEMKTTKTNNYLDYDKLALQKQKQRKVFSKILKGRNPRYIKSKGTNFIFKYNSEEQAKQLLDGKIKPTVRSFQMIKNDPIEDIDNYDINVLAGPPQKLPDNRDYQAQLKNQKAHRLMRMRKKHFTQNY